MNRRMTTSRELEKYHEWQKALRRGQDKVARAKRSAGGLAQILAESTSDPTVPRHRQPNNAAAHKRAAGSTLLPAWLRESSAFSAPASASSSASGSNTGHIQRRSRFLSLPLELRNLIYEACIDYPSSPKLFDTYYAQVDKESKGNAKGKDVVRDKQSRPRLRFHTPTILLLNKQIAWEALEIFRTRPFILDRIPPWIMGFNRPLYLSDFVGSQTLQNITYIELRIALGQGSQGSGKTWTILVHGLLAILSEGNAVIELKVMFKLSHVGWQIWQIELSYYKLLIDLLEKWERKHGRRPGTLNLEHWVMDGKYAYRVGYRNPLVRMWPNAELWSGDILEFL